MTEVTHRYRCLYIHFKETISDKCYKMVAIHVSGCLHWKQNSHL